MILGKAGPDWQEWIKQLQLRRGGQAICDGATCL